MPKVDVTDEAIIQKPPIAVYNAILNEVSGITQWWMPNLQCKSRDNKLIDSEGGIFDATIHPESRLRVKVSCTVTKMVEAKSITIQYAGDFIGTGEYTFEPVGNGTRLKFRFNVETHKTLMTLFAPFVNLAKAHSEVMQQGFKACNDYLKTC